MTFKESEIPQINNNCPLLFSGCPSCTSKEPIVPSRTTFIIGIELSPRKLEWAYSSVHSLETQNSGTDIISRAFHNPHLQQLTETGSCILNDDVCSQVQARILPVQGWRQCLRWRICTMNMKRRFQPCVRFWVHISYRQWVRWHIFRNIRILLNQWNSAKCFFFRRTTTSSGYRTCPWSRSHEYWMPFLCTSAILDFGE